MQLPRFRVCIFHFGGSLTRNDFLRYWGKPPKKSECVDANYICCCWSPVFQSVIDCCFDPLPFESDGWPFWIWKKSLPFKNWFRNIIKTYKTILKQGPAFSCSGWGMANIRLWMKRWNWLIHVDGMSMSRSWWWQRSLRKRAMRWSELPKPWHGHLCSPWLPWWMCQSILWQWLICQRKRCAVLSCGEFPVK